MKALWNSLKGDSVAVVLVVVVMAYTYLRLKGVGDLGFLAMLGGVLAAKMAYEKATR